MRDIKFRAWSTNGEPKMIQLVDGKIGGRLNDLQEDEDWKVMQFTGLIDRNGVEIYEGDLVLMNPLHNKPHEVRWHVTGWSAWSPNLHHDFMEYGTEWEVIGNIYEQGHLLEATQ